MQIALYVAVMVLSLVVLAFIIDDPEEAPAYALWGLFVILIFIYDCKS